jgi:hypothetical protein
MTGILEPVGNLVHKKRTPLLSWTVHMKLADFFSQDILDMSNDI